MPMYKENFDKIYKFLNVSEEEFEQAMNDADDVSEYTQSKVGNKDYWQVSESELRLLYAAVKILKPDVIAETGVGPGTTSTAILMASREKGSKLLSFDLGQRYGQAESKPVGFVVPDELRDRWNLIIGDSKETLPESLSKFGPIDMFFHDSEHTYDHVLFELETAMRNFNERFLIVIDNYNWSKAPEDFAKKYGLTLVHVADDMCFIFRE